nr:hypothetical protein Iba_chr12dCG18030 [Ipomoea batatas]
MAPASMSFCTQSIFPCIAASINGVTCLWRFNKSGLTDRFKSTEPTSIWPLAAAICRAEWRSYTVVWWMRPGSLPNTVSTVSTSPHCTAVNSPCSSLVLQLSP